MLTFVTVGLGLLAGRSGGAALSAQDIAGLPEHPGRAPFVQYCGQCHALARPLGLARREKPDEGRWQGLVAQMQQHATERGRSVWTPEEGRAIVGFLLAVGQGDAGQVGPLPASGTGGDDHGRGRGRGRGGEGR